MTIPPLAPDVAIFVCLVSQKSQTEMKQPHKAARHVRVIAMRAIEFIPCLGFRRRRTEQGMSFDGVGAGAMFSGDASPEVQVFKLRELP